MMARTDCFAEMPLRSAIPLGSRMTRLNEFHECYGVDSCHSSIRAIRDKIVPEFTVKPPSGSRMNEFNDGQRPEVLS